MEKAVLIIFLLHAAFFVVLMLVTGKTSIKKILLFYFKNYYSNAEEEKDRKFNAWFLISLGILPYVLGALLFFSFPAFLMSLDVNLLLQVDVILLTIFCLFIGLDLNKDGKNEVKNELIATLLVNILLIVASVTILLIAHSLIVTEETPNPDNIIKARQLLFMFYYAFNFKIFIMFFYSLKRMFVLSSK